MEMHCEVVVVCSVLVCYPTPRTKLKTPLTIAKDKMMTIKPTVAHLSVFFAPSI